MSDFEFSQISMPGGYAGLWRAGSEPFNVLLGDDGRPLMFETSLQAIRAAKEHVRPVPAPMTPVNRTIDVLGVQNWRREKADAYAEGQLIRKTGSFRPFTIERKKGKKIVRSQV
jgi:hypothetical protein